jgi:tRNA G26 N,N-dimethylase Trm1
MVEIFKTNVQNKTQAKRIINLLKEIFSEATINFDLNDCDKILRVDGIKKSYTKTIVFDLKNLGFTCEILN